MNVFLNAKGNMFSRLNVDKRIEMTRREWLLILIFFGLIVVSAAARYAIIILDMKKNDESNKNVLNNFDETLYKNRKIFQDFFPPRKNFWGTRSDTLK